MEFKELIFISGKGGTGKSTFSAWLGLHLANQGKRVLLVELQDTSSVASLLGLSSKFSYKPTPSGLGFDLALLTGLDCLVEYVGHFTRLEGLTQKVFESSVLKSLVNVAPGLNDLSLLGKLTSHFRGHGPSFKYDHIIVDAPSTGSFASLINAPKTLGKSVSRGPLHTQSMAIDECLKNTQKVQYLFMTLFEELPMDELEDTLAAFHDGYSEQINVVANRFIGFGSSSASKGPWFQFVESKLNQQTSQLERLKALWARALKFDLITDPLKEALQRGEIRPL